MPSSETHLNLVTPSVLHMLSELAPSCSAISPHGIFQKHVSEAKWISDLKDEGSLSKLRVKLNVMSVTHSVALFISPASFSIPTHIHYSFPQGEGANFHHRERFLSGKLLKAALGKIFMGRMQLSVPAKS